MRTTQSNSRESRVPLASIYDENEGSALKYDRKLSKSVGKNHIKTKEFSSVQKDNFSKTGAVKQQDVSFKKDSVVIQSLKSALKEAMDENDKLRQKVALLESMYSAAQDEIQRKNQIILDFAKQMEDDDDEETRDNDD